MQSEHIKLFEDLMSGDKNLMSSAEARIQELKKINISEGIGVFFSGMQSEKTVVSQLATLMLKKTYLDDPEIVKVLTNDQIESLKSSLKSFINFDKDWKSIQRLADALAKLYAVSNLDSAFADILFWFGSQNSHSKQFAVYLIEVLCELSVLNDTKALSAQEHFIAIFTQALSDTDTKVRNASLQACTQFLNNLKENSTVLKFASLAENILMTLVYVLKNDSTVGKSALSAMNSLTESHPRFWKQNLESLIEIIVEIGKEKSFSNEVRESAIEIVYALAKKSPAFLRKSENFKNSFIPLLFTLLMDLDNTQNLDAWNSLTEESENDLEFMYFSARDGVSRLAVDLGGKSFAEATIPYIKKLLASENWIENHSAFITIGYMAQGCAEIFKTNVVEILSYISNGLVHSHPRVIYSALTALGFLLDEVSTIQNKYHSNVLPALCKLMSTNENPSLPLRVRTQACSALVNFLRGMVGKDSNDDDKDEASEIIKPYAQGVLQIVCGLFENSLNLNYGPLQEETLTCLSLMATLMDKDFAPFYPNVMPGLKQIFYNLQPVNSAQSQLKSNAIETISYLCSSISENSESFKSDLKELAEAFYKLLSTLKEEDPQVPSLLTAFSHISTSMREDFYPYLEFLLPLLENYIKADIGFKLEDADIKEYVPEDSASKEDNKLSVIINMQGIDNKKLSMNSYALQNKIMALNVLHEICLNMGKSFYPYLERFLVLTKSLLKFPYSYKVRKLSIKSLFASILTCSDDEQQKKVFDFISTEIVSVLEYNIKTKLLREIKAYLKILIHTCEEIKNKNIYSEDFVVRLYKCLQDVINFVEEQKHKVKEYVKNDEGLDENDDETLESDINILNETARRVMELSGILFKIFKTDLEPLITTNLYSPFLKIWTNSVNKTKNSQETLNSVCFFDDYLSYSTESSFKAFYPLFLDLTIGNFSTTNEDILQSAVWGLGVIAERLPKHEFASIREKILNFIINLIKRPVTENNSYTYDNAIGALGKYVFYQANLDDEGRALSDQFLSLLPLKHDLDEGESVNKIFLTKLSEGHPILQNQDIIKEVICRMIKFRKEEDEIFDEEGLVLFVHTCMALGISHN